MHYELLIYLKKIILISTKPELEKVPPNPVKWSSC